MKDTGLRRARVAALVAALLVATSLLLPAASIATHAGNHPSSKGNVANKPVQAKDPDTSSEDDDANTAGVQITPNSGSTRTVTVKVDADDGNGHNDVTSVKVTVYKPDNATVHISESSATKSTGTGKTATYSHDVAMDYWHAAGTYHVKAVATDRKGDSDTAWSTFEYLELTSLSTNTSTASFDDGDGDGKLDPETDTHASPVNVSIENSGNVPVDLSFKGTDLTNSDSDAMGVGNLHLDADQDGSFSTNEWTFKTTKQTVSTFDLAPSNDGSTSAAYVLLAIHVPDVPPGTYTGSMTLEAVKST